MLVLEPYASGSHRAWATGYQAASSHAVALMTLPGRFWKWRMHGAALTLARRLAATVAEEGRPDVIVASDMLDLAAFLGLARHTLGPTPAALYMHENQLAYPAPPVDPEWDASRRRRARRRDMHYPFVNVSSALAADVVLWNSEHNRSSFLERLPRFLNSFPDFKEPSAPARIAARSRRLPVGIDLGALDAARPPQRPPGPPRVVWNHRWEHDKDPETFFRALDVLVERGVAFEVVVLGEAFGRVPDSFERARKRLGPRVRHYGFAENRATYARLLWSGDVVVSTARHEFFGVAVCEAAYCRCRPVLPRRLAYPELFPARLHPAVLYEGFDALVARLTTALTDDDDGLRSAARAAVARFDWARLAPRYDRLLGALATGEPLASEEGAGCPSAPGAPRPGGEVSGTPSELRQGD